MHSSQWHQKRNGRRGKAWNNQPSQGTTDRASRGTQHLPSLFRRGTLSPRLGSKGAVRCRVPMASTAPPPPAKGNPSPSARIEGARPPELGNTSRHRRAPFKNMPTPSPLSSSTPTRRQSTEPLRLRLLFSEHPNTPGDASKKGTAHMAPPPPNPRGFWAFTRAWGRGGERGPQQRLHGGKRRPRPSPPSGRTGRPEFPSVPIHHHQHPPVHQG